MDGVSWGSGEVALAKAQSAAAYQRDTSVFDERLKGGRMAVLQQPFAFPIQGGVCLEIGQQCVGGIGASGALAHEDTEICKAAALLLSNS
jgi:glc operon protein GlcG